MTATLTSSTTPTVLGDFARFDRLAREGATLNVVFLGGSLTWGARATDPQLTSYRALMGTRLRTFYPTAQFWFWDAAIGGTGSQLATFRLERDVFSRKPDLIFLDFTINDGPYDPVTEDKLASYEAVLRRLLESGAPVVQMLLAVKSDMRPGGPPRFLDPFHKKLSEVYGTALGDAVAYMSAKVAAGQADPDAMWPYPPDTTHPGDKGYALYAETAWEALQNAIAGKKVAHVPAKMLHQDTYLTWRRQRLSQAAPLPAGWKAGLPTPLGVAFDFYMSRWLDDVSIAEPGAQPLRLPFRGSVALLFGETSQKSGKYLVQIDGKPAVMPQAPDGVLNAHNQSGNGFLVKVVADKLDPTKEHMLEIVPQLQAGEELRIESLCTAG